jgi:hypothetical protein
VACLRRWWRLYVRARSGESVRERGGGERGSKIFGDFRRRHAKNFSFGGQRWVDENYMVFSAAIGWPAKIIW